MDGERIRDMIRGVVRRGRGMNIRQIEQLVYIKDMRSHSGPAGTIPYYLDRDGFTSGVVRRAVDEMADTGGLTRRNGLHTIGNGLRPRRGAAPRNLAGMRVSDLLLVAFSFHPLSKFIIPYKLGFMPRFKSYCNRLARTGTEKGVDDLLDSFDKALVEVPDEKDFAEFELLFNDFSRALHILLGNDPDHDDLMPGRLRLAVRAHEAIWDAFVAIDRLSRPCPYYKGHAREWTDDRGDKMAALRVRVGRFLDSVGDLDRPSRLMGEAEIKFLKEAASDDDLTKPVSAEKELEFARSLL
ncbi:hypothetical protein IBTHAUMO2_1090011 [Nitrosopumilaceae archaeon]|nr:hypothetical protein [Nitrosopumilus sp.]CAI9830781.1 hypothetical protein IBTHAUMO2_1090011 [Nitrosopumilaceae archaeon]